MGRAVCRAFAAEHLPCEDSIDLLWSRGLTTTVPVMKESSALPGPLTGKIKHYLQSLLRRANYEFSEFIPHYLPEHHRADIQAVLPYTITTVARLTALLDGVEYVVSAGIPGDFVECGVWKGGSAMAMALGLKRLGATDRKLYLFDTFSGMSEPTNEDVSVRGEDAAEMWPNMQLGENKNSWCLVSLESCKENLRRTGYPESNLHFVKGKVEDTLPGQAPEQIALLRLDTDWFESTYHELVHLYPRLSPGGMLILDDYGYWDGARKAVDQYFSERGEKVYLHRVDETGRVLIKS